MNAARTLARLREAGVTVAADGCDLFLDGPDEVLTEDVLSKLRAIKAELIEFLSKQPQPDVAPLRTRATIAEWRTAIASVKPGIPEIDKLKTVSLRFLDSPDAVAAVEHGWDAVSLFGMHEGNAPKQRVGCWGLVLFIAWGVHGCTVETIGQKVCALCTRSGAVQTLRNNRAASDEAVPWWLHPGIVSTSKGDDL